jgi:hypothetical protein
MRIASAVGVTVGWLCGDETEKAAERSPFAGVEDIVAQYSMEQFRFFNKQMVVIAKSILENY